MADMGLRRDEALYLKAESVQGNLLYIRGKGSKERVIPITTPRLKAELKKALKRKTEYLTINLRTGKPYTTIRKTLKRAVTASNINKPNTTTYSGTHSALMQFEQKPLGLWS